MLHAPRSRAHPRPRSSTLRVHRIGRARRVVDRLESPVRYVRQFPFTTSFRPSLLTWPRPFHPDFHSGPPAAPTTCRPGTPSTEQCPPHPQHEPGWAAGRLVARALLGSGRLARCYPLAPAAAPWLPPGEPWLRARFSRSVEPSPPITHGPWPWPTPTSAAPARNRLCPRYPPHTALPAHPRRDSSIATSLCRVTAPLSFIGFLLITVPASPF